MLNSLCMNVLPLDIAIHIAFVFLTEGQKAIFRFMYSIIKCNKQHILSLKTKDGFVKSLRQKCSKMDFAQFLHLSY
jgi:hypothetical protein